MTTDELVELAHRTRNMPYSPATSAQNLAELLKAVSDCILEGNIKQGVVALARIIDSLENEAKRH
ncbi:hypothetical protein [Beggiatoa leptomitoformis]|uniref:Uncharacterized protein n=1 Tax=Beggiatoa leptomitoformis TaxID=288004 RepID=A0A2N9YCW4_9GAMM|nr:hypothetical protein [Beggiatoa leptomitoformis]ALG66420.1 hypothetical protein AL038_00035 [Beggiatoa leptomitoformis]AUI68303.1 hypothetical protein BLE401_06035 [Beggiatoa leptomitoformis]